LKSEHHVNSSKRRRRPTDPWFCEPAIFLDNPPMAPDNLRQWRAHAHCLVAAVRCKTVRKTSPNRIWVMSALGQKQTFAPQKAMSALPQ
jgi:hypothetical protein